MGYFLTPNQKKLLVDLTRLEGGVLATAAPSPHLDLSQGVHLLYIWERETKVSYAVRLVSAGSPVSNHAHLL